MKDFTQRLCAILAVLVCLQGNPCARAEAESASEPAVQTQLPDTPSPEITPMPEPTMAPEAALMPAESPHPTPSPTPAPALSADKKLVKDGISAPSEGLSNKLVKVSSNVEWTAHADVKWIRIAVKPDKSGFVVSIDANEGDARTGKIKIKADGCDAITLKVRQDAAPSVIPEPSDSPEPSPSVEPSDSPEPSPSVEPSDSPEPSPSVKPSESPEPSPSVEPSESPEPSTSVEPSESPEPSPSVEPSDSPEPSPSVEPSDSPEPSPSVEPSESPEPSPSVKPSESPEPSPSVEPSELPEYALDNQSPYDTPQDEPPVIEIVAKRDQSVGWKGVVPSDEAGMSIPKLYQYDYRTVVLYCDGTPKSAATSGCGAASVSMVVAYLTGNTVQNPYTLFCQAADAGKYSGNGLSHGTLSWLADTYGVHTRWIANNKAAILDALESGKPVVAHMGEGIFTEQGHYIVLRGVTEDGKLLVNDPNSQANSGMAFPVETILGQARTGKSFMVCWSDDMADAPFDEAEPVKTPASEETSAPDMVSASLETPAPAAFSQNILD